MGVFFAKKYFKKYIHLITLTYVRACIGLMVVDKIYKKKKHLLRLTQSNILTLVFLTSHYRFSQK